MSALPLKADVAERHRHVRFVPKADNGLFSHLVGIERYAPTLVPSGSRFQLLAAMLMFATNYCWDDGFVTG
jgi:hypothetical protein